MMRHICSLLLSIVIGWPSLGHAQTWYYPGGEPDTSFDDGTTTSGWQPNTFNYGAPITLPTGTVTQLGAYVDTGNTGTIDLKLGLYTSGGSLVVQASPITIPNGLTKTWRTSDVTDTAISAGTYYVLGSASTTDLRYGYDSSGDGNYANVTYASSMASSVTINGPETGNRYGVRAEVGSSAVVTPTMMMLGVGP